MELQKQYNGILFICAMICLVCYDLFGGLWLKGLTSAWFVGLGFLNLYYASKFSWFLALIVLGLICGMCADVLLAVHFILVYYSLLWGTFFI